MTLAAQVWHFWIALPLAGGAIALVVATIVGYIKTVTQPRYPSKK